MKWLQNGSGLSFAEKPLLHRPSGDMVGYSHSKTTPSPKGKRWLEAEPETSQPLLVDSEKPLLQTGAFHAIYCRHTKGVNTNVRTGQGR